MPTVTNRRSALYPLSRCVRCGRHDDLSEALCQQCYLDKLIASGQREQAAAQLENWFNMPSPARRAK